MNVALTPEQREFVKQKVSAGTFESPAEVLRQAIDLWREQETLNARDIEELRQAIALGIAQLERGETVEFDAEDIKREGRQILAARKASAAKAGRKRT